MNGPQPRTIRAVAGTLLAAAVMLGAAGCTSEGGVTDPSQDSETPRPTLTVGLTYQPDIQFAPFYIADAMGWAASAEHAIFEIRHHGMSEALFGALAAGVEDIVIAGGDEMYVARGEGIGITAVMTMYRNYPVEIIVPAGTHPHPTSPGQAALERGMSVGIPAPYGENWYYLKAVLANYGLEETDIDIVHIGYTQQAALMTGRVDAVVGFVNNDVVRLTNADFAVSLVDANSGEDGLPLVGASLGVADHWITDNPAVISEYVEIIKRAVAYIVADPERAVDISAAYVPGLEQPENRRAALETLIATIPLYGEFAATGELLSFGEIDAQRWAAQADFLVQRGLASDSPANEAFATEFAGTYIE